MCMGQVYIPDCFKTAQILIIKKWKKPKSEVKSYRSISLLPIVSKLLEKLLLKRILPTIAEKIPAHQFGIRRKHFTIDQAHRIKSIIKRALEENKFCTAVFLDVKQAFNKVLTYFFQIGISSRLRVYN